jgi:hypothetical protein
MKSFLLLPLLLIEGLEFVFNVIHLFKDLGREILQLLLFFKILEQLIGCNCSEIIPPLHFRCPWT